MASPSNESSGSFSNLIQKIRNGISSLLKGISSFLKGIWAKIKTRTAAKAQNSTSSSQETSAPPAITYEDKSDKNSSAYTFRTVDERLNDLEKRVNAVRWFSFVDSESEVNGVPTLSTKDECDKTQEEHEADLKALIPFLEREGFSEEIDAIQKSNESVIDKKDKFLDLYYAETIFNEWHPRLVKALDDPQNKKQSQENEQQERILLKSECWDRWDSLTTTRKEFFETTKKIKSFLENNAPVKSDSPKLR